MLLLFLFQSDTAHSQGHIDSERSALFHAMEGFSATTSTNGAGADAYGTYLSADFSRWTVGDTVIIDKKALIESVRGWFGDGWRVTDRNFLNIEIHIKDNYAFARRIANETYKGPSGDISSSKSALSEVWHKMNNRWLLLQVNVDPIKD